MAANDPIHQFQIEKLVDFILALGEGDEGKK